MNRGLAVLLLGAGLSAAAAVQVIETAPAGSVLDDPKIANALDLIPCLFAGAESTIDIAQMYMLWYPPASRGRVIHRLYDELVQAARRGVRVRVLLDSTVLEQNTDRSYHRARGLLGEVDGIEVRACDLRPYSRYADCMMHAKYVVVDGRLTVVGSHNWSYGAFVDNREVSLIVDDEVLARGLSAVFDIDWAIGGGQAPEPGDGESPVGTGLAVTAPSGLGTPGVRPTLGVLVGLIDGASASVDLEVNSISTRVDFGGADRFNIVDSLLRAAANRGVTVRLLVDKWAYEHEPGLLHGLDSVSGIDVRVLDITALGPNPDAGTAHAKLLIADRARALVGSSTLSQRQLVECRNAGAVVNGGRAVVDLCRVFDADWESGLARPVQSGSE